MVSLLLDDVAVIACVTLVRAHRLTHGVKSEIVHTIIYIYIKLNW